MNSKVLEGVKFGAGVISGVAAAKVIPKWTMASIIAGVIGFGTTKGSEKLVEHVDTSKVYLVGYTLGYAAYNYYASTKGKYLRSLLPLGNDKNIIAIIHTKDSIFSSSRIGLDTSRDFIKAYNEADHSKDIHVVIHSPGGALTAVETIVGCILNHTGTGRFIAHIPYHAYSGGCAIAIACHEIHMTPNSIVGPCDGQLHSKEFKGYSIASIIETVNAKTRNGEPVKEDWIALARDAGICQERQRKFLRKLVDKGVFDEVTSERVYEELFSGKYNHDTPIKTEELITMGLNVIVEQTPDHIIKYVDDK